MQSVKVELMRIIKIGTLEINGKKYPDCKQQLAVWARTTRNNYWNNVNELKVSFSNISILNDNRVVFNIGGNKYRLIVNYRFDKGIAYINWFGTHADYDKIDANDVWDY